jgi:hypothetical protein
MQLTDQETTVLHHLVEADGTVRAYSEAKKLLQVWQSRRWSKVTLQNSIDALSEKGLDGVDPCGEVTVTEAGIAALKSI